MIRPRRRGRGGAIHLSPRLPRKERRSMMRRVQTGSDESVQGTASDAAVGKLSAASLGYFEDRFLGVLVGAGSTVEVPARRLPPVINRGNFARVMCIEKLVRDFIGTAPTGGRSHDVEGDTCECQGGETALVESPADVEPPSVTAGVETPRARKSQVISLGAGKDSLFFRLADGGVFPSRGYFEVDFPAVSSWKARLVSKIPVLSGLVNESYKLVAADLRDSAALEEALIAAGVDFSAPTIFLAECVLVYMEPVESAALLQWCSSKFPEALFAAYEMTSPHDAFGKMMRRNIQSMGCLLPGLEPYPTLQSQEERLEAAGWDAARAIDMLRVYQDFLDPVEVERVSKIEMLDEVEEWELIMRHYCLIVAAKGRDALTHLSHLPKRASR